jgi:DNA-binding transcriptional regulator YiaG
MPYRYKESGLDDVVLHRGYTIRQTPYGETVAIHDVDRVHRKIAAKLAKQPQLTGAELRFLRLEMDKTQAALADQLGTSEQTLCLWERDRKKPIPETAAKLLQIIVDVLLVNHLMKRGAIGKAIKKGLKLGTVAVLTPRSHRARFDDDAVRMPAGVFMPGKDFRKVSAGRTLSRARKKSAASPKRSRKK